MSCDTCDNNIVRLWPEMFSSLSFSNCAPVIYIFNLGTSEKQRMYATHVFLLAKTQITYI